MKRTRKSAKPVSADAIARLADQGKDVSHFFKGQGRMVQPIQRVNVDVTATMLEELDKAAQDLNVSRQAVIKTLVRQALDQHYLAQRARRPQPASWPRPSETSGLSPESGIAAGEVERRQAGWRGVIGGTLSLPMGDKNRGWDHFFLGLRAMKPMARVTGGFFNFWMS